MLYFMQGKLGEKGEAGCIYRCYESNPRQASSALVFFLDSPTANGQDLPFYTLTVFC